MGNASKLQPSVCYWKSFYVVLVFCCCTCQFEFYSSQGVEIEETPYVNVDNTKDQKPKYKGPHLNFHIYVPPIQPNPYAFIALVPQFTNNDAL